MRHCKSYLQLQSVSISEEKIFSSLRGECFSCSIMNDSSKGHLGVVISHLCVAFLAEHISTDPITVGSLSG